MNIKDIFPDYGNDPKCLYCKHRVSFLKHLSSDLFLEYYCQECNETFTVIHKYEKGIYGFVFSILNKEIHIHLNSNTFSVVQVGKHKSDWLPCFKFNFSDKEKLNNKINKLLTFL